MSNENLENKVDELLEESKTFVSPTLTTVARDYPKLLPKEPYPQCVNCQQASWMLFNLNSLRCYCMHMRVVSWDTDEQNPILLCDGIFADEDKEPQATEETPTVAVAVEPPQMEPVEEPPAEPSEMISEPEGEPEPEEPPEP